VHLDHAPDLVAVGALCDPCLDIALAQADEYRARFEAMIEAGVSRADANRCLIAAIARRDQYKDVS
jgi:hypothetical protein